MPDRYVILHHRQSDGEHWDLMLEQGGILWTWQLLRDPTNSSNFPIPARRIADHRLTYLTFEGPISGDRGTVRRIDAGTISLVATEGDSLVVRLEGILLRGTYTLRESAGSGGLVFDESL